MNQLFALLLVLIAPLYCMESPAKVMEFTEEQRDVIMEELKVCSIESLKSWADEGYSFDLNFLHKKDGFTSTTPLLLASKCSQEIVKFLTDNGASAFFNWWPLLTSAANNNHRLIFDQAFELYSNYMEGRRRLRGERGTELGPTVEPYYLKRMYELEGMAPFTNPSKMLPKHFNARLEYRMDKGSYEEDVNRFDDLEYGLNNRKNPLQCAQDFNQFFECDFWLENDNDLNAQASAFIEKFLSSELLSLGLTDSDKARAIDCAATLHNNAALRSLIPNLDTFMQLLMSNAAAEIYFPFDILTVILSLFLKLPCQEREA